MNPTMDLHKSNDEIIEEFVRKHGAIGLDWHVPNFSNTRVRDLIKDRLPIETTRGKILYSIALHSKNISTQQLLSWTSQQAECTHS